jgi:hypothetical protein
MLLEQLKQVAKYLFRCEFMRRSLKCPKYGKKYILEIHVPDEIVVAWINNFLAGYT